MKRLGLMVLLVLALPVPAMAHVADHSDPDDVSGKLDVKKISLEHDNFDLTFAVTTHSGWSPKAVKGVNGGMNIYLDSAGDDRLNYYAVIYAKNNKKLACDLYNRKGDLKEQATASKKGASTVTCELALRSIKMDGKNLKWAVQTSWQLSRDSYAYDYIPNEGYLKHRLGG